MLELIKVLSFSAPQLPANRTISMAGMGHIAFGVDNIDATCKKIALYGGKIATQIHTMENGNTCAFAQDPEHNWIELIQRKCAL